MIQGSCFHLRHIRKNEIPRYVELLNHPDTKGEFLPLTLLLEGAIENRLAEESLSKENRETFVIVDGQGQLIGHVFHFKTIPYFNGREIGYGMFAKDMRGKGIMSEAVQLLTDYLFQTQLINRLDIHMDTGNIASEKIAIRCGYKKEGVARGAAFTRGKHTDIAIYALLRDEWEAARAG